MPIIAFQGMCRARGEILWGRSGLSERNISSDARASGHQDTREYPAQKQNGDVETSPFELSVGNYRLLTGKREGFPCASRHHRHWARGDLRTSSAAAGAVVADRYSAGRCC